MTSTSTRVPGIDEAGDADDLVHLHRDRAHACGNRRRQPAARSERRELAFGERLVLGDPTMAPRLSTPSILVNEPGTGFARGQGTSFTSSLVTNVPTGSRVAATTACRLATSTSRTGMPRRRDRRRSSPRLRRRVRLLERARNARYDSSLSSTV